MNSARFQLWTGIILGTAIKLLFFSNIPPFWDSILLCSDVPKAYYKVWPSVFLPEAYAAYPRYPPGLGYYTAACWKLTGISLFTLHLAYLPFVTGIVCQLHLLCNRFHIQKAFIPILLLISIEPTLSCQIYLVNTDCLILFFFLLGMNAILSRKKYFLALACCALILVSPRGMVYVGGLFAAEALLFLIEGRKSGKWRMPIGPMLLPYIWPAITFILWAMLFYRHYGWSVLGGPGHQYSFGVGDSLMATLKRIPRNLGLIAWRLMDFGRILTFILIAFLIRKLAPKLSSSMEKGDLGILAAFLAGFMIVATAAFSLMSLPIGHRYFLPAIFLGYIVAARLVKMLPRTQQFMAFAILLLIQLAGNNLQYPRGIAVGWDATLGHLPYHTLREETIRFMEAKHIPVASTGCWFPNLATFDNIDFNGSSQKFKAAELDSDRYIFYSNVFNDITDPELEDLFNSSKWAPLFQKKKGIVEVILFEKRGSQ